MARKRPNHHARQPVREEPSVSQPVVAASSASSASGPRTRLGRRIDYLLVALGCVAVAGWLWLMATCVWQRWIGSQGLWPTPSEAGLDVIVGAVIAVAAVLAAGFALLARRAAAATTRRLAPRLFLLLALVPAAFALSAYYYENNRLRAAGLISHGSGAALHDDPGIYYVQAVRQRLQSLYRELDERRTNQPDQFSDGDAARLEVVIALQENVVGWTEQQIGHWLDDPSQGRGLMAVVAYQVHPLASSRWVVEQSLEQESRDLDRRKQWLVLLQDYCQQKEAALTRQQESGSGGDSSSAGNGPSSAAAPASGAVKPAAVAFRFASAAEMEQVMRQKLESLGLQHWAFARSVRDDTSDGPMIAERLNQIVTQQDASEARSAYAQQTLQPLLAAPQPIGLNEQHRWLQLPVYFPNAREWAANYFPVRRLNQVFVFYVVVVSLFALVSTGQPASEAGVRRVRLVLWGWCAAAAMSLLTWMLFYLL